MKAESEEMHHSKKDDEKIAKIKALSNEVIEDTKDVKKIQKSLSQVKTKSKLKDSDSDSDDDEAMDLKANKKKAVALEKKQEKEAKKQAIEMEEEEEAKEKLNKKTAVEMEKLEDLEESHEDSGSAGRITKILKMLEEEIVARSNKDTEPEKEEVPDEKPCKDGMGELKKYFSGSEGLKRSNTFIKFAKLLTGGNDEEPGSSAQVPSVAS